jgi:hypothetical protein
VQLFLAAHAPAILHHLQQSTSHKVKEAAICTDLRKHLSACSAAKVGLFVASLFACTRHPKYTLCVCTAQANWNEAQHV